MEGSEVALTSALLAALGAAVYFVWSGSTDPNTAKNALTKPKAAGTTSKATSKKGKKRKTNDLPSFIPTAEDSAADTNISEAPKTPKVLLHRSEATIPGGFGPLLSASEMESTHSAASSSKGKKKKKSKTGNSGTPTGSQMLAPPIPSTSASTSTSAASAKQSRHLQETSGVSEFDSESEWKIVKKAGRGDKTAESTSDAGVTTSATEEEGSVASKREETLTFAEKMLPKPAKTPVDDMIEGPKPGIARVLRVPGPGGPTYNKPAQGLSWEDYEDGEDVKGSGIDADEEDSTWDVVSHKRRGNQTPSTYASDAAPSTIATSVTGGAPSKKQRQNAAKREAAKSAKVQDERERLAALERHKRQQEQARIDEQFKKKSMKMTLDPTSGKPVFE